MKKKLALLLSFLLTLAFVVSIITVPSVAASNKLNGSGQRKDPYLINTVEDLCTFRDMVNSGNSFNGQFILQTADLDLSSIPNWTPIGDYGSGCYFYGTYNGGGHTISNLTIDSQNNAGFFGVLGGNILNLGIESGRISGICVGAFVGHSATGSARILNCYNKAEVIGKIRAGGIADNFAGGHIAYCYNSGTLTVTEPSENAAEFENMGGIVAYDAGVLYNCTSYGTTPYAPITFMGYSSNSGTKPISEMNVEALTAEFKAQTDEYASYLSQLMSTIEGEGTEESPYLIDSAEDLSRLSDLVNMGAIFQNKWFRQTADIDLSGIDNWTPIGKYTGSSFFHGIYDGNGHTISNLTIRGSEESDIGGNVGLFGVLAGTVMNLGIESGYIEGTNVGAFTSHGSGSLPMIINCYNKATVVGSERAGGIADNLQGGIIVNCLNTGEVTAPMAGGIASYGAKRIISSYSLGIAVRPAGAVGIAEDSCREVSSVEEAVSLLNSELYSVANRTDYQHNNFYKWENDGGFGEKHNYLFRFIIQEILIAIAVFGVSLLIWAVYTTYKNKGSLRNGAIKETMRSQKEGFFGNIDARIKSIIVFGFIFCFGMLAVAFLNADNTITRAFFYSDSQDAFMDFINPMQVVLNNNYAQTGHYTDVEGTYPPIARLVFWLIGQILPTSTQLLGAKAIRSDYGLLLTFFVFACCMIALLFIYRSIQKSNKFLIPMLAVFCSPMIFLVDRGNILIIALVLSAIFIAGYRSKNPFVRHLSYICLAIAAAIKIYPAILGLLLIREKKWKNVIICVGYGLAFCILPFFFIGGFKELALYARNVTSTFGEHAVSVGKSLLNYSNTLALWSEKLLGDAALGRTVAKYTLYIFTLLLAGCALVSKSWWRSVLAVCMIMVLFPGFSIYYCGAFFALAMVCFVSEKHTRKIDYVYAAFFTLMLVPLQFLCGAIGFTQADIHGFTATLGVILAAILIVDCIVTLIKNIKAKRAEKRLALANTQAEAAQ